jgi:hypothetical protein
MKIAWAILLFAASAVAQSSAVATNAACGVEVVNFNVKLEDSAPASAPPAPGKALIYFIHDAGTSELFAYPTTKLGVDGKWAGANHGNSYFSISVDPGEHHMCATLQSSLVASRVELAHFMAEAEKVYYYRTRLVLSRKVELLELEQIDSDQGKYLIDAYPLSISTPKKAR